MVSFRTCCRDILRCETKKAFEEKYDERKKLWVLPGYIEYFEKNILKDIDRSGLWTAREHGWKVTISDGWGVALGIVTQKVVLLFYDQRWCL